MAATPDITLDDLWVTVTGPSTFQDSVIASGITLAQFPILNNSGTCSLGPSAIGVNGWYPNMPQQTPFTWMQISASEIVLVSGIAVLIDPTNPAAGTNPAPVSETGVFATLTSLANQITALTARVAALEAKA